MTILYGPRHNRYPSKDFDRITICGTEAGSRAHWRRGEKPCESCRKAHNRAKADRQRRHRAQGLPPDDPRHGAYGYNSYNCRCDICLTEGRARRQEIYRRKRNGTR